MYKRHEAQISNFYFLISTFRERLPEILPRKSVFEKQTQILFNRVNEIILAHELSRRGLHVDRQVPISIEYDGIRFDEGFRADLIVENKVILELKSVEKVTAG